MSDEPEGLPVRDEVASIVTMLQCYMLHVTLRKINFGHFRAQRIVYINNILFIYTIL